MSCILHDTVNYSKCIPACCCTAHTDATCCHLTKLSCLLCHVHSHMTHAARCFCDPVESQCLISDVQSSCHRGQRHKAQVDAMQQQSKASTPDSADAKSRPAMAEPSHSGSGIAKCLPSPLAQLAGQDHQQTEGPAVHGPSDQLTPAGVASRDGSSVSAVQKGIPSPANYSFEQETRICPIGRHEFAQSRDMNLPNQAT